MRWPRLKKRERVGRIPSFSVFRVFADKRLNLNGPAVDPSGELLDGRTFDDIEGFKALLLTDPDQIGRNLVVHRSLVDASRCQIGRFSGRFRRQMSCDAPLAQKLPVFGGGRASTPADQAEVEANLNEVLQSLFHTPSSSSQTPQWGQERTVKILPLLL